MHHAARRETTTLHDSRLVLLFGDLESPPYRYVLSLDQLLAILSVALPRTRRRTNCTSTATCIYFKPRAQSSRHRRCWACASVPGARSSDHCLDYARFQLLSTLTLTHR
jgi:hypothetical protein